MNLSTSARSVDWTIYANQPRRPNSQTQTINQLRHQLKAQLPEYMIPSTFVVLDTFPLTPNGKVNRRALPTPMQQRFDAADREKPRTPEEAQIAQLWIDVLSLEVVGIHDNFFDLGGHSLLAAELLFRLQQTFDVELVLLNLFMATTVAEQAALICDRLSGLQPKTATLDLWAEAVLDDDIYPNTSTLANTTDPKAVLLTGATGFLGAFLLHELLQQTQAEVYCLVRAPDIDSALHRIQHNLQRFSLWQPEWTHRIIPVLGDLSQPQVALSAQQRQTLAENVDIIYHNGAMVNFMHPYSVMKATNVSATEAIIRLASQTKIKPIHFISTLGVFSPIAYDDNQVIAQHDAANRPEGLYGYTQSKWVAEKLLAIAKERGIPSTIYRPAWVEGHSQTGMSNQSDFLRSLIKGCIQLGVAPDWTMPIDIVPVDYISKAIVKLSQMPHEIGPAFNVVNPERLQWNQLINWLNAYGYRIRSIPYGDWMQHIKTEVKPGSDNALAPFLAFLTDPSPDYGMTIPEMYFKAQGLQFNTQNLHQCLADDAPSYPAVLELLPIYFDYFIRSGFLNAPPTSPNPSHT